MQERTRTTTRTRTRTRTTTKTRTALAALLTAVAAVTGVVATVPAHAAPTTTPVTTDTIRTATAGQVFAGGLFVQPDGQAAQAVTALTASGDTAGVAAARTIAAQPVAIWLGEWFRGDMLDRYLARNLAAAEAAGRTPVFVTYAIPNRDCGGYSAGGLSAADYVAWNQQVADGLRGHRAVVLVEPDSLSALPRCTSEAATRPPLLAQAVSALSAAGVPAYLDGGNSTWNTAEAQATLLRSAGISQARGFFTNVANFQRVDQERAYGDRVSALTGGSHYVVDVSRNGRGWKGTWCNPTGAGLGQTPHVSAGTTAMDALLWVKTPGSSDGTCNGGPAAGKWWSAYAQALVANRR
jgi:endoglucanase